MRSRAMAVKAKTGTAARKPVLKTNSAAKRVLFFLLYWGYTFAFYAALVGLIIGGIYALTITPDLKEKFEGHRWKLAGHVYSDSLAIVAGQNVNTLSLKDRLVRMNYQPTESDVPKKGEFKITEAYFDIHLRDFRTPDEKIAGYWLRLSTDKFGRIISMTDKTTNKSIYLAEIEPELIGRFFGPHREERDVVGYEEISPYLTNAIVTIEDNRFFTHHGVNFRGLIRSTLVNLYHRRFMQGGSSITQQLVKNFYLTPERTLSRKLREMVMAVVLEMLYTKEEIFECYLNEVYFGQSGSVSVCGVGEASKFYFGKDVRDLDLAEAALLAGLIRSPDGYNPRKKDREQRAKIRRDYILSQMAENGLISKEQSDAARNQEIKVHHHTPTYTIAPYFVEFLKKQLSEKYSPDVLISDGLRIYTTLDVGMQRKAEKALREGLEELEKAYPRLKENPNKPLQAAMVVIDPNTGAIRAMVGGRDFAKSQFNRAVQSKRQTGSVFKPFVYTTAFVKAEEGEIELTASDIIEDSPVNIRSGNSLWSPQNYDRKFRGPVTVRQALEKSLNVPTVKIAQRVGTKSIIETAHKMGIVSELPPYPSIALGVAELSLLEVASAYSTLAALGTHAEPISIKDVISKENEALDKKTVRVKRAIPARAAFLTVHLLKGVVDRGTAARARRYGFKHPAAGKTGTTNDYKDAWFVGFTPNLLAAVWVGFDSEESLRLSGSSAALPIWINFMKSQTYGEAPIDWEPPPGVVFKKIDYQTGKLAVYGAPKIIEEAYLEGQEQDEKAEEYQDPLVEFFKKTLGKKKE